MFLTNHNPLDKPAIVIKERIIDVYSLCLQSHLFYLLILIWLIGCMGTNVLTDESGVTAQPPDKIQPSRTPTSQPAKIVPVQPEGEMIEPTAAFSTIQVNTDTVSIVSPPHKIECPHLESSLLNLSVSEDPEAFAQSHLLFYAENATRATIELLTPNDDTSFLSEYNAHIETQTESLVQALVPLPDLCALSNDPQVKFVHAPRRAISP